MFKKQDIDYSLLIFFGILIAIGIMAGKTLLKSVCIVFIIYGVLLSLFGIICGLIYIFGKK